MDVNIIAAISKVTDLAKPVVEQACEFAESLLGEPLRVAGGALADHVYGWQTRNRVRILEKTRQLLEERNVSPRPVATGFLIPALEAMGNTEDESLQELWARLLAGAMDDTDQQGAIFVETLRKLSAEEAVVLNVLHERARQHWQSTPDEVKAHLKQSTFWKDVTLSANKPPTPDVKSTWPAILGRLEAVSVIERDTANATRGLASSLKEYFRRQDHVLAPQSSMRVERDPFAAIERTRLSHKIDESVRTTSGYVFTPFGLDFIDALGLKKVE